MTGTHITGTARRLVAAILALLLAATPAAAEPALFLIRGGPAPVYLFGSIHAISPTARWQSKQLLRSFDSAHQVWFETTAASPGLTDLLALLQGIDLWTPLAQRLPAADYARLAARVQKTVPGAMPWLNRTRPWLAALLLIALDTGEALEDEETVAVDTVLQDRATAADQPILGFETLAAVTGLLSTLPPSDEVQLLHDLLSDGRSAALTFRGLQKTWLRGDLDRMARVVADMKRGNPVLHRVLIVQRNAQWLPQIEALLHQDAPAFVTVGAAHLAGPDSLRELLRRRGYALQRLQ